MFLNFLMIQNYGAGEGMWFVEKLEFLCCGAQ